MDKINIEDIYDKNINFLIGSGASYGLFPTLALGIKDISGKNQTIETLATLFKADPDKTLYTLLFMYYYKECVEPVMTFDIESVEEGSSEKVVIENYKSFLTTILAILQRRKNFEKKCNIFTTNYDGCFAHVADELLKQGDIDFILNDGSRGFNRRYLQAKNFNSFVYQSGIFERHHIDIPQINLIHVHGSVYWYKDNENIQVEYSSKNKNRIIQGDIFQNLVGFSEPLNDDAKTINDLPDNNLTNDEIDEFWSSYNSLPIVNPTKWKFHETVFEEHYYQMLRLLSYELEKPNSIFITFGFSFADEHILNLVKRSLSNPSLQVFICCFDDSEKIRMQEFFKTYKNVQYVTTNDFLDFTAFNTSVFCTTKNTSEHTTSYRNGVGE